MKAACRMSGFGHIGNGSQEYIRIFVFKSGRQVFGDHLFTGQVVGCIKYQNLYSGELPNSRASRSAISGLKRRRSRKP